MESNIVDEPFDVEKEVAGVFDQSLFVLGEIGISDEDRGG